MKLISRFIMAFLFLYCLTGSISVSSAAEGTTRKDQHISIKEYTERIANNPNDFAAYLQRGTIFLDRNYPDKAIRDFNKALEIKPDYSAAYVHRGIAYHKRQQLSKAISDYSDAIRIDPQFAIAYGNRAIAYLQNHQYDAALDDCAQAIDLNPKFANAYMTKANVYKKLFKTKDAIETYRSVLSFATDPDLIERAKNGIRSLGGKI